MEIRCDADVIEWRGPAPFVFARLPEDATDAVREIAAGASYGWGCLYVEAAIEDTVWTTSLMPREAGYLLPLKAAVRRRHPLQAGDVVRLRITVSA